MALKDALKKLELRKFKNPALTRKGISLVQVMMAAGLAGMVALISGQIITNQARQTRNVKDVQRELELRRDVGEVMEMVKENAAIENTTYQDVVMNMNTRVRDCLEGTGVNQCPELWTAVRIPLPTADTATLSFREQVAGAYTNDMRKCPIRYIDEPARMPTQAPDFSQFLCERDRPGLVLDADGNAKPAGTCVLKTNAPEPAEIISQGQICPIVVLTYWKHSCPASATCTAPGTCQQCTNLQFTYALMRYKQDQ